MPAPVRFDWATDDLRRRLDAILPGLRVEVLARTASTNSELCERARHGDLFPCLLIAEEQTAGRGRTGHAWLSSPGAALTFSLSVPIGELDTGSLEALLSETRYRMRIPKFPAVTRDINLILDQAVEAQQVLDAVGAMRLALMENVQLFDVFAGAPIPAGKRSLSFRFTYRSPEKTLEDAEVNRLHQNLVDRLLTEFQAALPR